MEATLDGRGLSSWPTEARCYVLEDANLTTVVLSVHCGLTAPVSSPVHMWNPTSEREVIGMGL